MIDEVFGALASNEIVIFPQFVASTIAVDLAVSVGGF